jgi:hypothetical protein
MNEISECSRVAEGSYAIFRKLDGSRLSMSRIKRHVTANVENLKFKVDAFIGKPYGIYNVKDGNIMEASEEGGNSMSALIYWVCFRDFELQKAERFRRR